MRFIVAGPSGVGKSYLIQVLLTRVPGKFISPPLITTRAARPGHTEIDRQSVSREEFQAREAAGDFAVTGQFHGNWYGYPAAIAQPQSEHIVVNTWPALLPKFADLPETKLIGLSVSSDNLELLRQRMLQRGDSPELVAQRMQQVKIDLADLEQQAELIATHGRMFEVVNDTTIPELLVPWVEQVTAGVKQAATEELL